MSFWQRVKKAVGLQKEAEKQAETEIEAPDEKEAEASAEEESELTPVPRDEPDEDLARLGRVGAANGPNEADAIAILRRVRGTAREHAAANKILQALSERPIPEAVRVSCADILAARGDEAGALRVLEGTRSAPALILAADLYASTGQLARAVGTIERVLARSIDAPGARERHARWSNALGVSKVERRRRDEATVVTATPAGAPFRLLREVARGGAGSVYEAEDEVLGRRVAFKVYHGRSSDRALLEREAKIASRLAGPGVLRMLDADPFEGWLATEWVARGSVRDVLRAGDAAVLLPIAPWAVSLARAIARVHEQGYVHADVKPANVMLRKADEAVLGDFGISAVIGAPGAPGSAGYVSPERISGRSCDPRDDVYGYGRVLEDVLERLEKLDSPADGPALDRADAEVWRKIAALCIGPDETRPADGRALLGVVASVGRD
ncbi:MAG: serine/threonine protein kinase [Polyangiaceae bacterium]|nr:serine/threonine protein kinase [Polyangiaceae bacterium]